MHTERSEATTVLHWECPQNWVQGHRRLPLALKFLSGRHLRAKTELSTCLTGAKALPFALKGYLIPKPVMPPRLFMR